MRIIVPRRLSLPLDKAYSLWRAHVHGAMHGARRSRSGSKGPMDRMTQYRRRAGHKQATSNGSTPTTPPSEKEN